MPNVLCGPERADRRMSVFEKVIGTNAVREAARALAKARASTEARARLPANRRRSRRKPGAPPAKGHKFPWGRKPPRDDLVWRGHEVAAFPDGRTRSVQVLTCMERAPGQWWGLVDLQRLLCADGTMSYNSLKAIVAKLLRRGWIERTDTTAARPDWVRRPRRTKPGAAWRLYRPTPAGRLLVEMLG